MNLNCQTKIEMLIEECDEIIKVALVDAKFSVNHDGLFKKMQRLVSDETKKRLRGWDNQIKDFNGVYGLIYVDAYK